MLPRAVFFTEPDRPWKTEPDYDPDCHDNLEPAAEK